ncbi:MAG: hypothetical protein AAF564_04020 [Bacteroidota bacterium]
MDTFVIPTTFETERYVAALNACSAYAGLPRWQNDWRCPGHYRAEIFKFDAFGFVLEDTEDAESDDYGFATFTMRKIKVFSTANILLIDGSRIIQGLDEYKEGNRVEKIQDEWQIHRATTHIEEPVLHAICALVSG